ADADRLRLGEALLAHQKQLVAWAENCPANFASRAALVGAEIARLEGRDLDAQRLYEQALGAARASGFVHDAGLACERASAFYGARGFRLIADAYLREARSCYARWGADGKVRQLDQAHPHLREAPGPDLTATFAGRAEQLDLLAVAKASQA